MIFNQYCRYTTWEFDCIQQTIITQKQEKRGMQYKCHTNKQMHKCIRFIGNMKENVDELVKGIACSSKCDCKHEFRQILNIYGEKIQKLRAERDAYKKKYFEDVDSLKNQLNALEEAFSHSQSTENTSQQTKLLQISDLQNKYMTSKSLKQLNTSSQMNIQDSSFSKQILSIKPKQEKQELFENVENLIKKYNIGLQELEGLVKEYVSEYENQFDSEEQKKLYKLGKKLEKQIWMKKVKKDIEVIVSARERMGENTIKKQKGKEHKIL